MALPNDISIGYFHAPISEGGLGIPSLRWLAPLHRKDRLLGLVLGQREHHGSVPGQRDRSVQTAAHGEWFNIHHPGDREEVGRYSAPIYRRLVTQKLNKYYRSLHVLLYFIIYTFLTRSLSIQSLHSLYFNINYMTYIRM